MRAPSPPPLTPSGLGTLDALARVVVPHAYHGPLDERCDVAARAAERLARAPEHIRSRFTLAVRALESGPARLLFGGRWEGWDTLPPGERERAFSRWGASVFPAARTVHQAVRRLLLSTYYTSPAGVRSVGALDALHTREPRVEWEGALAATASPGDAVVARGGDGSMPPVVAVAGAEPVAAGASPSDVVERAIVDAAGQRQDLHLTADVVIVGSGAGGAVAAALLAEAGRDVVVVEEGPWMDAADFDGDEGRLHPLLFADGGARTTDDLSVTLVQGGAVGGGTTVNWMIMLRTPDHVLEEWRRRFALSGLSPAAMAPVFAEVEGAVRAGPVPDAAHSPSNRIILDGASRLGWSARPASLNARGCMRSGTCSLGCRWNAKQDARLTWLPRAAARGARIVTGARVDRLERLERDTARGTPSLKRVHATVTAASASPSSPPGARSVTVDAPIVVLAAGAVGTPVILQRSGMGGGAVGRYLRLHPTTCVMGRYDREMDPLTGIPLSAMCDEFAASGGAGYGFWIECPALAPGLAAAALSGVGALHREAMAALRHTAPLIALTRDGSDLAISNGDVQVDRRGRTRVRYRLGPGDTDTLRASLAAAARLHLTMGAREAVTLHARPLRLRTARDLGALATAPCGPNQVTLFSAHVNGTCRMGGNRAESAATPEGERWGVPGLYVCDGSLLPTAPGVNPQETIMALATLVARGIASR